MNLPISLDRLGSAINAAVQKDKDGHRLMMRLCKPRKVDDDGSIAWWGDEADFERLGLYCDRDVLTECAIDGSLPPLSARERRVWTLDQTINDRGVGIDVSLVQKALDATAASKLAADRSIWRLTNGAVGKTTEVSKIVDWLCSRGHAVTSLAEGGLDDLILACEIMDDDVAVQVITLRRESAAASKFQAMLDCVCADGRVRGSLAYHAALTGRWAGRGIQPQNFKRLGDGDDEIVSQTLNVLALAADGAQAAETLNMLVGPPLECLSLTAKAMLVAAPGCRFIGGDFANIEGRVAAWIAGEAWKVAAFREYDTGAGPDLYRIMAAEVAEKAVADVTKDDRQTKGKVPELACGYQGGVKAFQKMAYTQRPPVRISDELAASIVRKWRAKNPMIVEAWADLQEAAINACYHKGAVMSALGGRVRYVYDGSFLFCQLPSSRVISYAAAVVEWKRREITIDGEVIEINRYGVSYWGMKSGRWMKQDLYGGSQFNHVVQGLARDLLVEAAFRVEDAGYPIVLTIHDELLTEVDEAFGSTAKFESLMSALPAWATGIPVTTKAWTDQRYTK